MYADFPRELSFLVPPTWNVSLPGRFTTDVNLILRPIDVISVALGTDGVAYRTHWNQGIWYGWWPAGPQLRGVPVGLLTDSGEVLYAARGLADEVRLGVFSVEDWSLEWPTIGVATEFQPAVATDAEGVHVMVVDKDGKLLHALRPHGVGSSWEAWSWSALSPAELQFNSGPQVIVRSRTLLDVFVRGTDNCVYWQSRKDGNWTGWVKVSEPSASNVLALADSPSSFFLFRKDAHSLLWGRRFSAHGWTRWTGLGEIAHGTSTAFPGSGVAFGENDVRLVALGSAHDVRMLTISPTP